MSYNPTLGVMKMHGMLLPRTPRQAAAARGELCYLASFTPTHHKPPLHPANKPHYYTSKSLNTPSAVRRSLLLLLLPNRISRAHGPSLPPPPPPHPPPQPPAPPAPPLPLPLLLFMRPLMMPTPLNDDRRRARACRRRRRHST